VNDPSIAIVTPSYNTARYIGDAVRSVLTQDYAHVDYVVMDGGSSDGTVDVLRSFGPRLAWVSQKDAGQSDAINRGFARTRGDVLGWLNSDDTYAPGAFGAVAEVFAARPDVDLVYGDATYTDYLGRHIARCVHVEPFSRKRLFQYTDFMVQPATFFRRRIYEKVGGVDASIHWAMDYDLWLRMVAAGAKVFYLRRVLANFRWLADNKTATGGHGRLDEIARILRRQGQPLPAYNSLERCNLYGRGALAALTQRQWGGAARGVRNLVKTLLGSPRAVESLLSAHTWRIMYVGQVLRRRAAVEHEATKTER
jgi:glycosyltransferase involved in cell wall biosynthesis